VAATFWTAPYNIRKTRPAHSGPALYTVEFGHYAPRMEDKKWLNKNA